jgi:hypothetical protein
MVAAGCNRAGCAILSFRKMRSSERRAANGCQWSPLLPEIGNEGWTVDTRRRKPTNLFIDDAPIGGKRPPIEIVQTYAATFFRSEAHADNKAIRLPDKHFSICASPSRSICPYELSSDKMLFGEELHRCVHGPWILRRRRLACFKTPRG